MLTYLIQMTQDLVMCALAVSMMLALSKTDMPSRSKRVMAIGLIAGFVAAAICAYIRNTTKLMDSGYFNLGLFIATAVLFVLFIIFDVTALRKAFKGVGEWIREIALSAFLFVYLVYVFQYAIGYVKIFLDAEGTVFSTDFLYDLIGWTAGLVLCLVVCVAVNRCAAKSKPGLTSIILKLVMILIVIRNLGSGVQLMIQHGILRSNHTLFLFVQYTTNNTDLLVYLSLILAAVIPITLLVKGLRANEPYRNPAEHRKIRAKWRNAKRWTAAFVVCAVIAVLNLTVLYAIDNQAVELSPVEDSIVDEDAGVVKVSIDQVSDGHLHRFAYMSPSGVEVRFIIIQKPNSASYGVGMDSCDICGEAGYYERDGEVVCKKCDVVMNINTIGFKGGCNPKVVDYEVADGYIQLSIDSIMQYEKDYQ